jgi:hypothetical protein
MDNGEAVSAPSRITLRKLLKSPRNSSKRLLMTLTNFKASYKPDNMVGSSDHQFTNEPRI